MNRPTSLSAACRFRRLHMLRGHTRIAAPRALRRLFGRPRVIAAGYGPGSG